MRSSIKFALIFLMAGLIFGGFYIPLLGYETLKAETAWYFSNVAESRAELVNNFLNEQKMKTVQFSEDDDFRTFLENSNQRDLIYPIVNDKLWDAKRKIDFFDEMFIISDKGDILVNTQVGYTPGDIFKEFDYSGEVEGKAYIKPIRFCYCVEQYVVDITTPIYNSETNQLMGLVVARMYLSSLKDIVGGPSGLEKLEKIYLINSDGLLVSSSTFFQTKQDRFTQNVDNENARRCLSQDVGGGHIGHEAFTESFLNYVGEEVLGTHKYISETDWCLLVEADVNVLKIPERDLFKRNIFMLIAFVVILSVAGYFMGQYFEKTRRYKGGKK